MITVDTGGGVLTFDPMANMTPKQLGKEFKAGLGAELPGTNPQLVVRAGGYFVIEKALKKPQGSGAAPRKMLRELKKLKPEVRERPANIPAISEVAKAIANRDAGFAAKYGLPERHDVWNLRQAMSQPGWDKTLARWLSHSQRRCHARWPDHMNPAWPDRTAMVQQHPPFKEGGVAFEFREFGVINALFRLDCLPIAVDEDQRSDRAS
jgi:hypothetical protein